MAKKNLKGQVSMWVIVAIVLVAAVVLYFLIDRVAILNRSGEGTAVFDVQSYIQECSTGFVNEVVDDMLPHGGFVEPKNYVVFNDLKIEYLCKNRGYYESCIHQHPLIIREMEKEIKVLTEGEIARCFDKMRTDFSEAGSKITMGSLENYEIDLNEDEIVLRIKKKIVIEKNGETRRGEDYEIKIPSPTYNLANIAREIADQEANFCYFEFVGYNVVYPRYEIKKFTMSDPTDVYSIKDLKSGKVMNIAIRGCAYPSGA